MIRQLGNPTWFCSFSAAVTRWSHLLKTLGRLVEKKDYTDCEIENMTWQQKSDLIQKDPVTSARNFEHMVQLFIRDVLKSDEMPIEEIVDFFYRVEFPQRGSPDIHALFWVKDAPHYCMNKMLTKRLYIYYNLQKWSIMKWENWWIYKHRDIQRPLKKGGHKICTFNFPLPPVPKSMILEPLKETHFNPLVINAAVNGRARTCSPSWTSQNRPKPARLG